MNWIKRFALVLFISLYGCGGVNYSLSGINIPPEVKTVSVKLFVNKAPLINPLLAQVYTEKLKDKFINQTSLSVIADKGDWAFEGYISNYVVEPVNRQSIGGGTRNKLTISISVAFENSKNEDENFERVFTRFKDFEASSDFSSIESGLVDDITDILVQDVFNETALKW